MRITRPLGRMLLCLMTAAAAGCTDSGPTQVQPNETTISLQSDAGDVIGNGQTYNYTPANTTIQVNYAGNQLRVTIQGGLWTGDFRIPGTANTLQNGTYTGAVIYPSPELTKPQMHWSATGRTCNTVTGSFTLQNVRYAGNELMDFDLAFEQHCNGAAPALRGNIHVRR